MVSGIVSTLNTFLAVAYKSIFDSIVLLVKSDAIKSCAVTLNI